MEVISNEKVEEKKRWQKSYFDVLGLCCSSEVPLIENILNALDGVKHVSVIVPSRTVIVLHDHLIVSQSQIVKALNQARLEANVRLYGETSYKKKWPSPYTLICGVLLVMSLLKYVYHPFQWLAIAAVAVGIFPILWRGIASVRNLTLDINILALIAVAGTVVLKDYLEAGTIVFLFTIAEWLESMASHKATSVMSSLMNMTPQKAIIAETGEVVAVDEVKLNTVLAVKAGEVIPIDGIVMDGKSEVDEKTLTGESFPVPKQKDSVVWAGTINLNGYISVMTTALAEDCVVAKMAKLVEEAQNSKSSTQRFIDRCAKYYTPGVLCISIGLAVIPAAVGVNNKNHWFHLALVVLVSACPCALILSTPVATFCALSQAATSGILIKGGDYLEILSKIKNMALDKTGTITRGEFVVTNFRSLHDDHISLNTLLYWISSIESKSSHPMATALIEYGQSKTIEPNPEIVEDFENFPGEGIYGKIDGKDIYVGNRKISQRAGCQGVPTIESDDKVGNTIGYVYLGATPVGIFSLSDSCRSGVVEAIKEIKLLGIKTAMLTGDSSAAAMHAQEQLGHALDQVHAELLPEDKAKMIEEFKKEGPTAMVGDGINDAPALATADIGISMGITGSALATETGHVVLMSNDINKIPQVIKLARKCQRKVIENVIMSILTKAAILALAFAGHPLVWAAVLADVGTCLLVIFNSMFLLRGGMHKHKGEKGSKSPHKHGCKSHDHSCHETITKPKECSSNNCNSNHCNSTMIDKKPCTKKALDHEADHCQDLHSHGCNSHDQSCHETASKLKECSSNNCASNHCNSKMFDKTECPEKVLDHDEADHCKDLHSHGCISSTVSSSVNMALSDSVHNHCEDQKNDTNFSADHHHHTSIDIVPGGSYHGCPGLAKRETGGCCKSFRKECCGKHGHFGRSLSEIVIE